MNPQLENGYTSLANEIIEEIIKLPLSNYEFRILLAIFRKTYGWNKKEDLISLTQLSEITKIQRSHCQRSLKKLSQKNIITVTQIGNGLTQNISFQKDYTKWKVLPKQVTVTNPIKKCYQSDQKVLPKQVTTKENTKEIQKKKGFILFSDFEKLLNEKLHNEKIKEALIAYFYMREAKKVQMTEYAAKLQINKLLKWPDAKIPINKILDSIEKSILNNWTDIYKPKDEA